MHQLRTEVVSHLDLIDAMEAATRALVPADGPKPSTSQESSPEDAAELPETTIEK